MQVAGAARLSSSDLGPPRGTPPPPTSSCAPRAPVDTLQALPNPYRHLPWGAALWAGPPSTPPPPCMLPCTRATASPTLPASRLARPHPRCFSQRQAATAVPLRPSVPHPPSADRPRVRRGGLEGGPHGWPPACSGRGWGLRLCGRLAQVLLCLDTMRMEGTLEVIGVCRQVRLRRRWRRQSLRAATCSI